MSTTPDAAPLDDLHARVLDWYADHARDLPWRAPDRTPWGVLVSEVMLQQTPVARVLPRWLEWLDRWPTPSDLAAAAPGEAVRAWDRLGYPRRALRLHAAAVAIRDEHGGQVPAEHAQLLALPGVGAYTAAAVASFAFGQRHAVVDTNVRRVHARAVTGAAEPATALTAAEQRLAVALLPAEAPTAARWAVAVMELGALVCTARSPRCGDCPLLERCAWVLAGRPAHDGPARRGQAWAGTDRQVRGKLLAVLRAAADPVSATELAACWPEDRQRARCLDGLVADGLVEPLDDGRYCLPRT
ncbi:A/G-specific adenine glycosylase [Kineococcus sp. LSe6-4]|uniref:Adenine DNA glycosylase n=1 Tax=Kineococcus halophytocola TaxID=3234027 RepID=A0ABV4H477_9ACTN